MLGHPGRQGLLEEGLFDYGPLATKASFTGAFGISVSPAADPALPLELELVVGDGIVRETVDDKLPFRIIPGRDAVTEVEGARKRVVAESHAPARIYNGADASAPVVAELPAKAVVEVSGAAGDWLALEPAGLAGQGRRLWVPADVLEEGGGGSPAKLAQEHRMVDPPVLELAPIGVDGVVQGATVTVAGVARHHHRVRDVVVIVRALGPAQVEHKVFYLANRALEGEEARSLEFSTEVPLAPGSNRVTILVRDHDKVERRQDLWVFRDDGAAE
ncbi:MAG: hypothetical protein KC457_13635 [Myxococcales bacterium]|nr:hypothetical protein [Myxococcales bacterium]